MGPIPHFYEGVPGWFDFQDIYREAVQRAPEGAQFVEVGSWLGRSTAFLAVEIANSGKRISLDCVDTWLGSPDQQHHQEVEAGPGYLLRQFIYYMQPVAHLISCVQKPSVEASRLYHDGSLDLIFIDADHSTEAVLADLRCWLPKLAPGGTLAGHDIDRPSVLTAVDAELGGRYQIRGTSWVVQPQ